MLDSLAKDPNVVAIGETGLDFNDPHRDQHRFAQYRLFAYQIKLAGRNGLPLILHIRKADKAAIRMLRMYRRRLHGGVVHCYWGDWETAEEYLDLGLYFGIGGALLKAGPRSDQLREAVRRIPLDRIVVETDSPYVLPDCPGLVPANKTRKIRNSSLILPEVVRRIAELKGCSYEHAEDVIYRNTLKLFGIPCRDE